MARPLIREIFQSLGGAIQHHKKSGLIEQTEQRAQRERLIADISRKMLAANDLHSIAQIAGDELGRALRISRAEVKVGSEFVATPSTTGNGSDDHA